MNTLVILAVALIFLFLIQIICEFRSYETSSDEEVNKTIRNLEDNTIDVNEKLGVIIKQLNNNTIYNMIAETNVKTKISSDILNRTLTEIKDIEKIIEKQYNNLLLEINLIKNRGLENKQEEEIKIETIDDISNQEKKKEIEFDEIKGKIEKLKDDLNIKNPETEE